MKKGHLRRSRRRGRPTTEPTLQRLEYLGHFTAQLALVASAHLALRPPSIWPFLISLRRFSATCESKEF
jgi:hypothetical protein